MEASNRRRDKIEVVLAIMEIIQRGGSKPTRIMYHCNLSWRPLSSYLEKMEKLGLIALTVMEQRRKHRFKKRYSITPKGLGFLLSCRGIYDAVYEIYAKEPQHKENVDIPQMVRTSEPIDV